VSETITKPDATETPVPRVKPDRPLWTRLVRLGIWLVALLILLYLPLVATRPWLRAGEYVMIGVVGAIGLTLLTGQAGQLSLAHGFFLLSGGISYVVLTSPGDADHVGLGLTPVAGLLGSVVISALLGLAFAPVSGRLRGIYLGVASLSLVFIGLYLGQSLPSLAGTTARGRDPVPFSVFGITFGDPAPGKPVFQLLGVPLTATERLWYLFLVLTVAAAALATAAVKGRPGRAWRAVRDNEAAASVLGVSVVRAKAGAFAVSSGYAGLAGAMVVLWFDLLKPDESEYGTYGINVSIAFLAMVIVGGLGSVLGAAVGAALVFGMPLALPLLTSGSGFLSGTGGGAITPIILTQFIYGAAIIAVVMFEPGGLAAIGRRVGGLLTRRGREG
jgi:branched-chain amino acid transport system permease protein